MSGLLLPRTVAEERERINADRRDQTFKHHAEQWTKEVKKLDPYLEVVRASETPTDPDLTPGGWYVLKHVPGSVDELIELPHPPGPWIYNWLVNNDMWNSSVIRGKRQARDRAIAAKKRAEDLEGEQRRDEMALAAGAAARLRDDRGMTHSSQKKREGKGLK